jgi:hypothetical protein
LIAALRLWPRFRFRFTEEVDMRSRVATKSTVIMIALAGTLGSFIIGAYAGAALNGRVMTISVARMPLPTLSSPVR